MMLPVSFFMSSQLFSGNSDRGYGKCPFEPQSTREYSVRYPPFAPHLPVSVDEMVRNAASAGRGMDEWTIAPPATEFPAFYTVNETQVTETEQPIPAWECSCPGVAESVLTTSPP